MTYFYRKVLLLAAIALFLLLAPVIVFYAIGYRSNSSQRSPGPVGLLQIETIPKRAAIEVNGQYVGRSPRGVTNLPPGAVQVRISKDGYHDWQKTVMVEGTLATDLTDVRLWPVHPAKTILLSDVTLMSLAPNRRLIAAVDGKTQLHVLDTAGIAVAGPVRLTRPPQSILWSPDSTAILLQDGHNNHIRTVTDINTSQLLPAGLRADQIVWDPRIPARLLAINDAGSIVAYNVINQQISQLVAHVRLFALSSRQIVAVHTTGEVTVHNLQGELVRTVAAPDGASIISLRVTPSGQVAALMSDQRLLLLAGEQWKFLAQGVTDAAWSPGNDLLLIQTEPNELFVYNISNERLPYLPLNQLQLITRLSRPITSVQWFAGGRHLLYQVADEIIVSEIDTRDHPLTYVVDTTNTGNAMAAVGEDGSSVMYLKREADLTNLIEARWQE